MARSSKRLRPAEGYSERRTVPLTVGQVEAVKAVAERLQVTEGYVLHSLIRVAMEACQGRESLMQQWVTWYIARE